MLLQHIYLLISCNCVWSKWFTATVQMDCGQVGSWHLHHHIGHKPPDAFGGETNGVPQQRSPSNSTQGRDCCANLFVESRTLGPPRLTQQPCRHFQYHPISSNIHEMMPHFLSFLILFYASTVVSLFISHITNVNLDMNDFFHINTYEWNFWMHRSICFQKTLYFNKQADMQKGPLKAWNTWPYLVLGLHGSCHDVVDRCDAALTEQHSLQTVWTWSTPSVPH